MLLLPLPAFSARLIKFYYSALIHLNYIQFAIYCLPDVIAAYVIGLFNKLCP